MTLVLNMKPATANVCYVIAPAIIIIFVMTFYLWHYEHFKISNVISAPAILTSDRKKCKESALCMPEHPECHEHPEWRNPNEGKSIFIGSAEWLAEREEIYAKRNTRIQEVCKGYSDLYESPTQGKMFWFDLNNHLAICMHAKVGCTTWKRNLLLLSNLTSKEKKLKDTPMRLHTAVRAHVVLPDQEKEGFNVEEFSDQHKLLKFSFVRHPYERLVSAYEDKVLNDPDSNTIYFDLVKKYDNTSFTRFVEYVLDAATNQKCLTRSSWCGVNPHFRPYYSNCLYCHIKYDVIGKLEDSAADILYIAIKQNLTTLLPELTKTNRKTRGHSSSYDRIEHYMSQLEVGLKWRLYELYQPDFELFGYEPI